MASSFAPKTSENVEDCRDYLRTGRCKYGASCKFNHPSNVQSGGGMKAPVDPSEPLYPVRPNEPVCQYYMKHGSCKFGQACKFHHPPQSSLPNTGSVVGSNTAIFIPGRNEGSAVPQQILLNSAGEQVNPSSMMALQFLPQRPDEPDCIYFLRNGRCKYGATCRYHHPIHYHQQRKQHLEARRPPQQQVVQRVNSDGQVISSQLVDGQTVQYLQQSNMGSRVVSTSGGGHVLVTETPIHVMSVGSNGGFQQIAVPVSNNGDSLTQEITAPATSLSSSYDASTSWNRPPKRNYSGGSLSAFSDSQQGTRQRSGRVSVVNESRHRAQSFSSAGSASDQSSYQDSVLGWSVGSAPNGHLPQQRYDGHAFEHPRRHQGHHFRVDERQTLRQQEHGVVRTIHRQGSHGGGGRPPKQSGEEVDHGLSMMTSALLNMMDTPDEAAAKSYPSRISSSSTLNSQPQTPRSANIQSPYQEPSLLSEQLMPPSASMPQLFRPENGQQGGFSQQQFSSSEESLHDSSQMSEQQHLPRASSNKQQPISAYAEAVSDQRFDGIPHHWSPTWQGSQLQPGGGDLSLMSHRAQATGPSGTSTTPTVGLFLS